MYKLGLLSMECISQFKLTWIRENVGARRAKWRLDMEAVQNLGFVRMKCALYISIIFVFQSF